MCVWVFFPFILDIKFVGRTSRGHTGGRSHRISHPASFCGARLNFSREKDSAFSHSFPSSTVKSNFGILCTNDLIVLHPLGIFIFIFLSEKNPVYRDRTHVPTCEKVTRLPLSYRGGATVGWRKKTKMTESILGQPLRFLPPITPSRHTKRGASMYAH